MEQTKRIDLDELEAALAKSTQKDVSLSIVHSH